MNEVSWEGQALDQLADIWVRATPDLRDRVEAAVNKVNRRLAIDAGAEGESRAGSDRVTFEDSLGVVFRYRPGTFVVKVMRVSGPLRGWK